MLPLLASLAHAAPAAHAVHLARPIALGAAHGRGARRDARRGPRAPPRPRQSRRRPCAMHMHMHARCTRNAHMHTCTPPCCMPGDVVLWRSDLAHSAAPPPEPRPSFRAVSYTCVAARAPRRARLQPCASRLQPCASRLQPCASRLQPRIPGACCPRCSRPRTWPSGRPRPTGRLGFGLGLGFG